MHLGCNFGIAVVGCFAAVYIAAEFG